MPPAKFYKTLSFPQSQVDDSRTVHDETISISTPLFTPTTPEATGSQTHLKRLEQMLARRIATAIIFDRMAREICKPEMRFGTVIEEDREPFEHIRVNPGILGLVGNTVEWSRTMFNVRKRVV